VPPRSIYRPGLRISSTKAARSQYLLDVAPLVQDPDDSYERAVDPEEDPGGSHDQLTEIPHPDPLQLRYDAAALRESLQRVDLGEDAGANLRGRVAARVDGEVVE
jgi:hypothetical protein